MLIGLLMFNKINQDIRGNVNNINEFEKNESKKYNYCQRIHASMCQLRKNTTDGDVLERSAQKSMIFSLTFVPQMSARFV